MVNLLQLLFSVVWHEEVVPPQWRKGLIVNFFKKNDKEDPVYRGITLLSVVGKVFCKLLNDRLVQLLDECQAYIKGKLGLERKGVVQIIFTL